MTIALLAYLLVFVGGSAVGIVVSWRVVSEYRFRRAQRDAYELLRTFPDVRHD